MMYTYRLKLLIDTKNLFAYFTKKTPISLLKKGGSTLLKISHPHASFLGVFTTSVIRN